MAEAGADLIEIGIPFSDPVAEGGVIQEASMQALAKGVTTDKIFDMVESIRDKVNIPLVIMTYINPVFVYGYDSFFKRCQEVGITGLIVPDVPYEESEEMIQAAKPYGVTIISLIAPTSKQRIQMIAQGAEGFIYCVSSLGTTGVRKELGADIKGLVSAIKEKANVPVAVGFGIGRPDQTKKVAQVADGVIVGSAIVRLIGEYGSQADEALAQYVREMKAAMAQK